MAHQLKLNIYTFSVKERNKKEAEFVKFEEFFREAFSNPDENKLQVDKNVLIGRFISEFINSFKNAFVINNENTKGFSTNFINPSPFDNIMDGMMKGGITGLEQEVFDRDNAEESEDKIESSKVAALPYYFKIWTPFDSSVGIIMLQSYTDAGVNQLMLDQLSKFFSENNYTMVKTAHVPEEFKEKYKKRSKIWKLTFIKQGLGRETRKSLNPVFTEFEGMKAKLILTGFKESPENFWKRLKRGGKILHTGLSPLEMVEDDDYDVIASFEDEFGHKSQAKVSKNLDILPTYFLSDELKEYGKESPDYKKIKLHTDNILEQVKKELGYTPEDVD